jgi:hypothetical protein
MTEAVVANDVSSDRSHVMSSELEAQREVQRVAMQRQLNALLRGFKSVVRNGGPATSYMTDVHNAASPLYQLVAGACAAGYEVEAEKDNRRVLKIGSIGPLHGTKFPYARSPRATFSDDDPLLEWCELVVIEEFALRRPP